jgi:amino acid adenylation domain-containing protein/non-ribosomal peptide synthase protein (TIGR01720 family)
MSNNINNERKDTLKQALLALEKLQKRIDQIEQKKHEPIAIIGMGCRLPGDVNTPERLWELLCDETDTVSEIPAERWDADAFYAAQQNVPGKTYSRFGSFLNNVDQFDPYFFGISPREATSMDPQQRLLLEVVWEALEDAGQVRDRLLGSQTGVFIGTMSQDYAKMADRSAHLTQVDAYYCTGNDSSFIPGRISYRLGLHGPSLAINTACSSSLVAVHLACQSLRAEECDMALAGGISLILTPHLHIFLANVGAIAPDGRCKTFDASANGMGRGEGCGVVVLKRLSTALADGDRILALIRGSAINHDGPSSGLTVPSGTAQEALIRQALRNAQVKPSQVSYIEAHGTGTILGDPIELEALSAVFREGHTRQDPVIIGSVKTNIGHLDPASGIAGLIKVVLMLQHREIPRHLHFHEPNPHVAWQEMPLTVPTQRMRWADHDHTRIAGVSSFGLSGDNAHVVLQEMMYSEAEEEQVAHAHYPRLLSISAHSKEALRTLAQKYYQFLTSESAHKGSLYDISYTAGVRRTHHDYRLAVSGYSVQDWAELLASFLKGEDMQGLSTGIIQPGQKRELVFVFAGQGSQWQGMGQQLWQHLSVFRQTIEQCDALLRPYTHWSLVDELMADEASSRIQNTAIAQPLLFVLEVALARVWQSWGITPTAVIGHSVGEIAAAHIAGILDLPDAIRIVYHRGRLMQQATGKGKMALINLPSPEVEQRLSDFDGLLSIAAINAPSASIVAGPSRSVHTFIEQLQKEGITCHLLRVDYAFHHPQMAPYQDELSRTLQGLQPRSGTIPFISTVTGQLLDGQLLDADYWGKNIRQPVLFAAAISSVLQKSLHTFIEIGPHPVLAQDITQNLLYRGADGYTLHSMQRHQDELSSLLNTLGRLYCTGYSVDFQALYADRGKCVSLPTYAWQRERFWITDKPFSPPGATTSTPELSINHTASALSGEPSGNSDGQEAREEETIQQKLSKATPDQQEKLITQYLLSQVSSILRLPLNKIELHRSLQRLGIDSLTALELKNRIEHDLPVTVSLVGLLQDTSLAQLQSSLVGQLQTDEPAHGEQIISSPLEGMTGRAEVLLPPVTVVGPEETIPLSYAQQRLWFLDQLDTHRASYNEFIALRLKGNLNREALEYSLNQIVQRHESIRTNIILYKEEPVQHIRPYTPFKLPFTDLQTLPATRRQERARELIESEVQRLFDLSQDLLIRMHLFQIDEQTSILLIVLHHIICDGWSIEILSRELTTSYAAFIAGERTPLPPLSLQYKDFASWQRLWLQDSVFQSHLAYWKRQLGNELPTLKLPTDCPRPAVLQYYGARQFLHLPKSLAVALKQLGHEQGATLFMTLLAVFKILLYRYTGQSDIVVGSPISNRHRAELEDVIGLFVNNLVLRTDLSGEPTFREVLQRVRKIALEAYAHQYIPFERLVEELQPERELNRYPLFQVAFILQGAMTSAIQLQDLDISVLELPTSTARVDLELQMWETEEELGGLLTYSTELFDASTIDRLLQHFETLLYSILHNPDQRISELSMLTPAEWRCIVQDWNSTRLHGVEDYCFHQLFERHAAQAPHESALASSSSAMSYQELNQRANLLAHYLRFIGVGPEVRVGVYLERSIDLVTAMLAVLKAGGGYVPLDPQYPEARLRYMLEDANPAVLLTHQHLIDRIPANTSPAVICLDRDQSQWSNSATSNPECTVTLSNLAYMIYTSGSTGQPKGVMVTHSGLHNLIEVQKQTFAIQPTDRILQFSALGFDASIWEFVMALGTGAYLCPGSAEELQPGPSLINFIQRQKVTTATLPPSVLAVLPADELQSLQKVIAAGEACSVDLVQRWTRGRRFFNAYGPTEGTVCATIKECFASEEQPPAIGRPIAGTEAYILDEYYQPVPIGVVGELYIGGVHLARGYHQRPDLTAERFIPHPFSQLPGARLYKTGDLARYTADGNITFEGRADQQVKLRGFRIELGEIEHSLSQHPAVRDVVVIAHQGNADNKRLVAYVAPNLDYLHTDQQEEMQESEYISEWQTLYEETTYQAQTAVDDPTFHIVGWNSSYTGEPIPAQEMEEQVEQAVSRILALRSRRVLEIGCGTGLILFRVAPSCEAYYGTDFSAQAIHYIQQQLSELHLSQVSLAQKMAHDLSDIPAGTIDVVVINSVVQYFPDLDYLQRVLTAAMSVLRPGGAIFIGDVRNYALLEAYHTSVEFFQAPDTLTKEALRQRIQKRMLEQEELLIDPAFFKAFLTSVGRQGWVQMQLKRGRAHNELTRFRYDVLIHLDRQEAMDDEARSIDWQQAGNIAAIQQQLQAHPVELHVQHVTNGRLTTEAKLLRWLHNRIADEISSVGSFRVWLESQVPEEAIEPEEWWELGERLGYITTIFWSDQGEVDTYNIHFAAGEGLWSPTQPATLLLAQSEGIPDWYSYSNHPMLGKAVRKMGQKLRSFLQQKLPEYMIPASFVVVERMPLTPNNKIDIQALPADDLLDTETGLAFVPPRTEVERSLYAIWSELLSTRRISIHDNFFSIGGHSLLATQVMARVRSHLKVDLPLRILWQTPTIATLAEQVERAMALSQLDYQTAPISAVPHHQDVVLSFEQQRLWFLEQLEPGNTAYIMHIPLTVIGPLNVDRLEQSIRTVVQRHEALRTTFTLLDDQPVQHIDPIAQFTLTTIDLTTISEKHRSHIADQIAEQQLRVPFDLAHGPLLRGLLIRLHQQDHCLLLCMHHIIADGLSIDIFLQEMIALYEASLTQQPVPLAQVSLQYADFALWQRQWAQEAALKQQLAYWKQQLQSVPILALPTDHPRPAVQSYRGAVMHFTIPHALRDALQHLSEQNGVTLFMTLLAAFLTLLSRYSEQTDIAVGTDTANRQHAEIERVFGFFVNTLVLRTDLSGNPTFRSLLQRVRETCTQAYTHQSVPFEQIVNALEIERDLSRNPLFQVHFALQNTPVKTFQIGSTTFTRWNVDNPTAKFDLSVNIIDQEDALEGMVEYCLDLFEASTIERMISHFQTLLASIIAQPDLPIHAQELLAAPERQQVLIEWNATTTAYPLHQSFIQLFTEQVRRTPGQIAAVDEGQQLTYQQINARANQLACYLQACGVGPEVLVGVYMERSLAMLISILAIFKAGGAYVPLDPAYPRERIEYILKDAAVHLVLTRTEEHSIPDTNALTDCQVVDVDAIRQELAHYSVEALFCQQSMDNLAYVIYTSGSTGRPKGAMITQRGMLNHLFAKIDALELTGQDRIAQTASHCFDISVWQFLATLLKGGQVHIYTDEIAHDPLQLFSHLREDRITVLEIVPSLLRATLDNFTEMDMSLQPSTAHLRWLVVTGEALPVDLCQRWLQLYPAIPIVNAYGPTECSDDVTHAVIDRSTNLLATKRIAPIGRALANTQLYILDAYLEPVPIGVPGQLYVGGAGVGRGYCQVPERTATAFIPNPFSVQPGERLYQTGDRARYLPDGQIEFLGRIDQQVKIRGYRIEPGEIEALLRDYPALQDVAVVPQSDTGGNQYLAAYLVPAKESDIAWWDSDYLITQLCGYLQDRLPDYMVPSAFVVLDRLPLTANGKLDRSALPLPDREYMRQKEAAAPQTAIEQALVHVWKQVLGVKEVGIHDNFFALGGDSILSIQIASRSNQMGLRVTPRHLFQYQTIAELATVADVGPIAQAEQAPVTGEQPLTPIQSWFFEQRLHNPHHWNQSVMLEVPPEVKSAVLSQALEALVLHHDVLRLRFESDGTQWRQYYASPEQDNIVAFRSVDLAGTAEAEQDAMISRIEAEEQARLHLTQGTLLRSILFDLGDQRTPLLLIIVHHLIIDGLSWHILLEDLQTVYRQLSQGIAPQLPLKTTSYKQWAERLNTYAQSGQVQQEQDYWLAEKRQQIERLPQDYLHASAQNTEVSVLHISLQLDAQTTRVLLEAVPQHYQAQLHHVLLTALARSLAHWTNSSSVLIDIEAHGREDLFEDITLARTMGWFTALFPAILQDIQPSDSVVDTLRRVKEQLDQVPENGIGYGLLRYLNDDQRLRSRLATGPQAEVLFNYLGQFGMQSRTAQLFRLIGPSAGPLHDQDELRSHLLEVNSLVLNGQLQVDWMYSQHIHSHATIERLVATFRDTLLAISTQCLSLEQEKATDYIHTFSEVELTQEQLDQIFSEIEIE